MTSYDGGVAYAITADRDAVPDVDVLGQCLSEALAELLDTVSGSRPRVPRGRKGGSARAKPRTTKKTTSSGSKNGSTTGSKTGARTGSGTGKGTGKGTGGRTS